MYDPEELSFLAVSVRNGVLILANLYGFCNLVLNWVCFLGETAFHP